MVIKQVESTWLAFEAEPNTPQGADFYRSAMAHIVNLAVRPTWHGLHVLASTGFGDEIEVELTIGHSHPRVIIQATSHRGDALTGVGLWLDDGKKRQLVKPLGPRAPLTRYASAAVGHAPSTFRSFIKQVGNRAWLQRQL